MDNYDLSTITRDNLLVFLNKANDEMAKYTHYREKLEECEKRLREAHKARNSYVSDKLLKVGFGIAVFFAVLSVIGFFAWILNFISSPYVFLGLGLVSLVFYFTALFDKSNIKKLRSAINEAELQLSELTKKSDEAFYRFFSVIEPYKFPRDYWYEYALTTMLKFIENKRADNWKEVTALYEEHLYRMRMEANAQQTLDEIKQQSDEIRKGRNAAQWAAAGAWASAAGIWRR